MRWIISLVLAWPVLAQALTLQQYVAQPERYGPVVMLRHALAPGGGDPANFDVKDCDTQRNLNSVGRAQSQTLGQQLSAAGWKPDQILSSPWCRCLETAELMNLGPVEVEAGLASFFEGHVDRAETLARLNQVMTGIDRPTLMVTHFVVISAVTGLGVGSGEAVVYNPETQQSWRLEIN